MPRKESDFSFGDGVIDVDGDEPRVGGSADQIEVGVDTSASLGVAGDLGDPVMKRGVPTGVHNFGFRFDSGGKRDG